MNESKPSLPAEGVARDAILGLLAERGPGKTICPSEAARRLSPDDWRAHMAAVHHAAVMLERDGIVMATWRSTPVSLAEAPGPYRLRRAGPAADAPDDVTSGAC